MYLAFISALYGITLVGPGGKPIVSDPPAILRAPHSGVSVNTMDYDSHSIFYIDAALGKDFPLITLENNVFVAQVSLKGGAWVSLGCDNGAFPLLTEDFLIAAPLSFKYDKWSGYISYNHISAHLGDGFDKMVDRDESDVSDLIKPYEKSIQAEGFKLSIMTKEPFVYSRDFMSILLMRDDKLLSADIKYYITAGYAHKIMPKRLKPWYLAGGVHIEKSYTNAKPYFSQDIRYNADVDHIDYSAQLGIYFKSLYGFQNRIYASFYTGSDRRGQLLGKCTNILGFGFAVE